MSANVKPKKNPFYLGEEDMNFINRSGEFHSDVFVIKKDGGGSCGNEEYEELMNSLYPFDPSSDNILNPYSSISKSTDKSGDIIIHVEWLEMKEEKDELLEKAKKMAEEEDRGDDKEYIKKIMHKLNGGSSINW